MLDAGGSESDSQSAASIVLADGGGSSSQRAGATLRRGGLVTSMTETIDRVRRAQKTLSPFFPPEGRCCLQFATLLAGCLIADWCCALLQEYDIGSNTAPVLP